AAPKQAQAPGEHRSEPLAQNAPSGSMSGRPPRPRPVGGAPRCRGRSDPPDWFGVDSPVRTMTRPSLAIVVAACTAAAVAARQAPSEPPRFRVAVDVVAIDAVVTDRNGEVVRDLTAADFEVLQNGKRQKVTFA